MKRMALKLYKGWVWLTRIRCRNGYGVHSPFAYNLIHDVVYNPSAYYAYEALAEQRKALRAGERHSTGKIDGLLFRLANAFQPAQVLVLGTVDAVTVAALHAGCWTAKEGQLEGTAPIGLLYSSEVPQDLNAFEGLMARATERSLFVVAGIHRTKASRRWWQQVQQDPRVGITFDLYEVGLLFFDRSRHKQPYKVNF